MKQVFGGLLAVAIFVAAALILKTPPARLSATQTADTTYFRLHWVPRTLQIGQRDISAFETALLRNGDTIAMHGPLPATARADTFMYITTSPDTGRFVGIVRALDVTGVFSAWQASNQVDVEPPYAPPSPPDSVTLDTIPGPIAVLDTVTVDSVTLFPATVTMASTDRTRLRWRYWRSTEAVLCMDIYLVANPDGPTATRLESLSQRKCNNARAEDPAYLRLPNGAVWASNTLAQSLTVTIK